MASVVFDSPVGLLEIKGSEEFIASVLFMEKAPLPSTEKTPLLLLDAKRQLLEYFSGSRKDFDLPLQQEGTEFQQRVWTELCKIPFGETISYLELANSCSRNGQWKEQYRYHSSLSSRDRQRWKPYRLCRRNAPQRLAAAP